MRADGWDRETILRLPNIDADMVCAVTVDAPDPDDGPVRPGEWLLDIGSNSVLGVEHFAERGLQVIALDTRRRSQGLYTADYFIEEGRSYFERVLGSMYDMPIASESLDYVFRLRGAPPQRSDSLRETFGRPSASSSEAANSWSSTRRSRTRSDRRWVHTEGVASSRARARLLRQPLPVEAIRARISHPVLEPATTAVRRRAAAEPAPAAMAFSRARRTSCVAAPPVAGHTPGSTTSRAACNSGWSRLSRSGTTLLQKRALRSLSHDPDFADVSE